MDSKGKYENYGFVDIPTDGDDFVNEDAFQSKVHDQNQEAITWKDLPNGMIYKIVDVIEVEDGSKFVDPPSSFTGCIDGSVDLSWKIQDINAVSTIIWSKTTPTEQDIFLYDPANGNTVDGTYNGRVEYIADSSLRLKNVIASDEGSYRCSVTFSNPSYSPISDTTTLYVYNTVNKSMSCDSRVNCEVPHNSISYVSTETDYASYNVCMTGGAAECLSANVDKCIPVEDNCRVWVYIFVVLESVFVLIFLIVVCWCRSVDNYWTFIKEILWKNKKKITIILLVICVQLALVSPLLKIKLQCQLQDGVVITVSLMVCLTILFLVFVCICHLVKDKDQKWELQMYLVNGISDNEPDITSSKASSAKKNMHEKGANSHERSHGKDLKNSTTVSLDTENKRHGTLPPISSVAEAKNTES